MIISRKTKRARNTINSLKLPQISVTSEGRMLFNAAAVDLLEIETASIDGVVFGYDEGKAYVAYSNDLDAYHGNFKKGEKSYRLSSKYEVDLIMKTYTCTDKTLVFGLRIDAFIVHNDYKFYELIKQEEQA